ncbi:MAG: hypothetical protein DRJ06_05350 [Candidatus Aminicenantes bacterium]|nr:MAG: hypothetical protein DRJ06_05350 [Candidatus Aminicenantes bacterium]
MSSLLIWSLFLPTILGNLRDNYFIQLDSQRKTDFSTVFFTEIVETLARWIKIVLYFIILKNFSGFSNKAEVINEKERSLCFWGNQPRKGLVGI